MPEEEKKEDPSLYEQFGGDSKMEIFLDNLIEDWFNDSEIGPYHESLKHEEHKLNLFRAKLHSFLKNLMDGSRFYIGVPLSEVHWPLCLTDSMFDKSVTMIIAAFKKTRPKLQVLREFSKRLSNIREMILRP